MSLLYLIRHGQASAGTHDYDRLSPMGQRQATSLGQWWTDQGFLPNQTSHGSRKRQRDTANLALAPAQPASKLTEHDGVMRRHPIYRTVLHRGLISGIVASRPCRNCMHFPARLNTLCILHQVALLQLWYPQCRIWILRTRLMRSGVSGIARSRHYKWTETVRV